MSNRSRRRQNEMLPIAQLSRNWRPHDRVEQRNSRASRITELIARARGGGFSGLITERFLETNCAAGLRRQRCIRQMFSAWNRTTPLEELLVDDPGLLFIWLTMTHLESLLFGFIDARECPPLS